MESKTVKRGRILENASTLTASKKFGIYKKESEKASRSFVISNEKVRLFAQIFADLDKQGKFKPPEGELCLYQEAVDAVKNLSYTAKDVEDFSRLLHVLAEEEFFPDKAGILLSALINCGQESSYVLNLENIEIPLCCVGYQNKKNLTVFGDVGDSLGDQMEKGKIIVHGDAEDYVGITMYGGLIIVKGNAENSVGALMKDGSIVIEEGVGEELGDEMEGGTIIVKGNVYGGLGEGMGGGMIVVLGDQFSTESASAIGHGMKGGIVKLHGNKICRVTSARMGGEIYHKGKLID